MSHRLRWRGRSAGNAPSRHMMHGAKMGTSDAEIGPTITALLERGPLAGRRVDVDVVEAARLKRSTCRQTTGAGVGTASRTGPRPVRPPSTRSCTSYSRSGRSCLGAALKWCSPAPSTLSGSKPIVPEPSFVDAADVLIVGGRHFKRDPTPVQEVDVEIVRAFGGFVDAAGLGAAVDEAGHDRGGCMLRGITFASGQEAPWGDCSDRRRWCYILWNPTARSPRLGPTGSTESFSCPSRACSPSLEIGV